MDNQQRRVRAALSRRGFLLSAAGVALAGCGGGGGGGNNETPGERFNGTYRYADTGDYGFAGSVTVDRNGGVTFWTLYIDDPDDPRDGESLADFGQEIVRDNRFRTIEENTETFGDLDGGRIRGRTQVANDPSDGFDWSVFRVGTPGRDRPPREFIGTFEGTASVEGRDASVILGVSPDGNATFLGFVPGLASTPAQEYSYMSLSFDETGNGYDYAFNLLGDSLALERDNTGNPVLIYTVRFDNGNVTDYPIALFPTFGRAASRGIGRSIQKVRPATLTSLRAKTTRSKQR